MLPVSVWKIGHTWLKPLFNYLDSGAAMYAPVDAVSVANITGTYSSSAKTFTVTATGALTVDGVTMSLGKRLLMQTQTTTTQQGIYIVTTAGAVGVSPVLTRADDAKYSAGFVNGGLVWVKSGGTTYGSTMWGLSFSGAFTLDTSTPTFTVLPGTGSAGTSRTALGIRRGTVTLVSGTATVADTSVTANTRIVLTPTTLAPGAGNQTVSFSVPTKTASTSFVVRANVAAGTINNLDTSTLDYIAID